jgi:hypothetical protein
MEPAKIVAEKLKAFNTLSEIPGLVKNNLKSRIR